MSTGGCPRSSPPSPGPRRTSWLSLLMFCFISSASIARAGPPASVPAREDTAGGGGLPEPPGPAAGAPGRAQRLLEVPDVGESLAALCSGGSTLKQKVCGSEVPPLSSIPSTTLRQGGGESWPTSPPRPSATIPSGLLRPHAARPAQTRSSGMSHRHVPALPGAEVRRAIGMQGGDEELGWPPAHTALLLREPGVPPALRRGAAAPAAAGRGAAVAPQGRDLAQLIAQEAAQGAMARWAAQLGQQQLAAGDGGRRVLEDLIGLLLILHNGGKGLLRRSTAFRTRLRAGTGRRSGLVPTRVPRPDTATPSPSFPQLAPGVAQTCDACDSRGDRE